MGKNKGRRDDMLDLAWKCDWEALELRTVAFPEEAYCINTNGRTALHLACFGKPPVSVVRAFLKVNPHAALWADSRSQYTPLHLACQFAASADVIEELVDAMIALLEHREALNWTLRNTARTVLVTGEIANLWDTTCDFITSADGFKIQSPLYLACAKGASLKALKKVSAELNALIVTYGLATRNQQIDVLEEAIGGLWQHFWKVEAHRTAPSKMHWPRSEKSNSSEREDGEGCKHMKSFSTSWNKLDFLLQQVSNMKEFGALLEVHAVASLHRSVPEFLEYTIVCFPNQLKRKMHGDLPMHLFVRNNCIADNNEAGISMLMKHYPESVKIPDKRGRLPLTTALDKNRRWDQGVSTLLEAFPDALLVRDPVTRLFPFMIAAIEGKHAIDTVFTLLQLSPCAIEVKNTECDLDSLVYCSKYTD